MSTHRFVTWNVCGIGSRKKRLKIADRLNDLKTDIVFLQETYMAKTSDYIHTFPHMYSTCYNSKQKRRNHID